MEIKNKSILHRFVFGFILVMLAGALGVIFWTTNKGVDLSDEGLSFALAQPNSFNLNSVIRYDLFFKLIYRIFHWEFGIIELRIMRFTGILMVIFFILKGFKAYNLRWIDKLLIWLALVVGYSILTESLSYFSLTLFFSFFFIYNVVRFLESKDFFSSFFSGMFLAFVFIVKPPSAILLYGIMTVLFGLLSLHEKNWVGVKYIAYSFLGAIVTFSVFSFLFREYSVSGVINDGIEMANSGEGTHSKVSIISGILSSLKWTLLLVFSGVSGAVFFAKRKTNVLLSVGAFLLSVLLISYFFFKHFVGNEFSLLGYSIMILTPFVIGMLLFFGNVKEWGLEKKMLFLVLFGLPFVCQFGSNVYFFRSGVHYLVFWILLFVFVENNRKTMQIKQYFGLILSVLVCWGVYDNLIKKPIKQPQIENANVKYCYNKCHSIYLNPKQADYLNNLKKIFRKYSNNKNRGYVIGVYCLTGHIVLTDMKIFYNPFIWNEQQLRFFVNKSKKNSLFSKIQPLVLSDKKDVKDVESLYKVVLLDSVKYINNQYVYLYQTK